MPGDIVFIVGGVLPFLWIAWLGVRSRVPTVQHVPQEGSFTEGGELPAQAGAGSPSRYASDQRGGDDGSG
jgi:nitric oxide reductase subunit B